MRQPGLTAPLLIPADHLAYLYERKKKIARFVDAVEWHLSEHTDASRGNLVAALAQFLYDDIDAAIARLEAPPVDYRPPYTVEDLIEAQRVVAAAENGLWALERMCKDLEANGQESSADFMRQSQAMQLELVRDQAKQRLDQIQQALEQPAAEPDPSNPWPGTHRIGTLCAHCARPFPGSESSIKKLKAVLNEAGWKRDADGDHICPECAAKASSVERLAKITDDMDVQDEPIYPRNTQKGESD